MERFRSPLHSLLLALFCASCLNGEKKESYSSVLQEEINYDDQGIYRSLLRPLNSQFGYIVSGNMEISISGDQFEIQGQIFAAPENTKHFQLLTEGSRCPNQNDDFNQDGMIDFEETLKVSGRVLIPLDSDLSEQLSGNDFGPIANSSGKYVYRESTSLSLLLSDLLSDDPDRTDIYKKLTAGEKINLTKRIVIILGLKENIVLPPSYKNPSPFSPQESVPIACGVIMKTPNEDLQL